MRTAGLTLLLVLLLSSTALAQYYLDTPKGYRLSAPGAASLLVPEPDELYSAACECSGVELDGLFLVEPEMSRFFELDRSDFDNPVIREHSLARLKTATANAPAAVRYEIKGSPIYVGFGIAPNEGFNDYAVITLLDDPKAGVTELDRFVLGAEYSAGIYALDLNNDGVIELAAPYSTGASGGGIDVRAIVPTGGLAHFGNDELDSTLFSQTGYINLLDYDNDGDWEIETTSPVFCSACGYMWNDLWTFDSEAWNWESDPQKFAAYYKPQQDLYRALQAAVQKLAARPGDLAYSGSAIESDYATQIGGQWYTLDLFMNNGRLDKTWVSQLNALVDGWK